MLKVINNKIMINRGDIGVLAVSTQDKDGNDHVFQPGDVLRLRVMTSNNCDEIVLQKDVTVEVESTEVDIRLYSDNTKIGDIINNPKNYWYEVELNPDTAPQTIIGYDDKGPKLFVLYPEGGELK